MQPDDVNLWYHKLMNLNVFESLKYQIYIKWKLSLDWDFTSPSWITKLGSGQTLVRVVDGNGFIITGDGKTATINGFPVTEKEWQDAINGQPVTLKSGVKEAKLTVSGKNVSLDGNSITEGAQIANCVSPASSSPANTSSGDWFTFYTVRDSILILDLLFQKLI